MCLRANWIQRERSLPDGADDLLQSGDHLAHREQEDRKRQKRSDPESSSQIVQITGDRPEAALGATGSSAIPQIGQSPGLSEMTSGCIGQVYLACGCHRWIVFSLGAFPHFGHDPCSVIC